MAHHMYTTDAVIVKRIPYDTNVSYLIHTKDLGFLSASATGVRKSESKLRYGLQEYSFCTVSLVKGRHVWRLTGVIFHVNFYLHTEGSEARRIIARICAQVTRLVVGEEKDERLFEILVVGLRAISETDEEKALVCEILLLLRLLYRLGYVPLSDVEIFVTNDEYTEEIL